MLLLCGVAVALQQLGTAHEIAKSVDSEQKWRQLSDLALRQQEFELALSCLQHCDDVAGLLLLYTCLGKEFLNFLIVVNVKFLC